MKPAVFLDRDGVLIEDIHLLTRPDQIVILPGVPGALKKLADAGFKLVVVSNQPVVSRGLVSEDGVRSVHQQMESLLRNAGAPPMDAIYFCPHHPKSTLPAYQLNCDCRKPKPGMFLQAAKELGIDLRASFTVGDRITDIIAGAKSGGRTVLVQTGKHLDKPIETSEPLDTTIKPDYVCVDLAAAADWIVDQFNSDKSRAGMKNEK